MKYTHYRLYSRRNAVLRPRRECTVIAYAARRLRTNCLPVVTPAIPDGTHIENDRLLDDVCFKSRVALSENSKKLFYNAWISSRVYVFHRGTEHKGFTRLYRIPHGGGKVGRELRTAGTVRLCFGQGFILFETKTFTLAIPSGGQTRLNLSGRVHLGLGLDLFYIYYLFYRFRIISRLGVIVYRTRYYFDCPWPVCFIKYEFAAAVIDVQGGGGGSQLGERLGRRIWRGSAFFRI